MTALKYLLIDIQLDPNTILQELSERSMIISSSRPEEITCAHSILHGKIEKYFITFLLKINNIDVCCLEAFMVHLKPIRDCSLKYLVYRDLWLRGKYISKDDRYGAEFIIYYDDPLYSHSSHAITLIDHQRIRSIDFISIIRTCTEVNKFCVLAYLITNDNDNSFDKIYPEVHYQTIEWYPANALL